MLKLFNFQKMKNIPVRVRAFKKILLFNSKDREQALNTGITQHLSSMRINFQSLWSMLSLTGEERRRGKQARKKNLRKS